MSIYVPTPTLFLKTDKKKRVTKSLYGLDFQGLTAKRLSFLLEKEAKRFDFPKKNGTMKINAHTIRNWL